MMVVVLLLAAMVMLLVMLLGSPQSRISFVRVFNPISSVKVRPARVGAVADQCSRKKVRKIHTASDKGHELPIGHLHASPIHPVPPRRGVVATAPPAARTPGPHVKIFAHEAADGLTQVRDKDDFGA